MKKLEIILGVLLIILVWLYFTKDDWAAYRQGVEEYREVEEIRKTQDSRDFTPLKENFKMHMAENYGQTSWYKTMNGFDIIEVGDEVHLGIAMTERDAYKDFEMPVTDWIDNESTIKIDTLVFIYESKIVERREF